MSEEIKEMDKEFNQTAIKQESASNVDEKVEIAGMESNKNLMYGANYNSSEMLYLLGDCLSEIEGDCIASCDHVGTPDCMNDCDTYNLKERIQTILKKAKGK